MQSDKKWVSNDSTIVSKILIIGKSWGKNLFYNKLDY